MLDTYVLLVNSPVTIRLEQDYELKLGAIYITAEFHFR